MSVKSPLAVTGIAATLLLGGGIAQADMLQSIGAGEGEVAIVAWPGYIERGETDPNFDWVTGFEKETGCKVTVKTAGSSDEMVSLMNGGGFDLVTASGDASVRLIRGGTVQPINLALIPEYSKVDPKLQNAPWHTEGGQHYGVPWQWGANVLMYNADVFENAPQSWSVVFEEQVLPDGKSNKGRVEAYYGTIYLADAALYLMVNKPELGIKDPYELNQAQFDAVVDLLRQQRQLVNRYWSDVVAQMDDFVNEGVVASTSWPFQVNTLRGSDKIKIGSTVPKEGATGWADTTMMHVDAPHPNCAYMWLNHSLTNVAQAGTAAWFGSVPAVPAACDDPMLAETNGCIVNGIQLFNRIHFWRTPEKDCPTQGGECVPYRDWVSAVQAVQSGQ
ncbi:putative spermidine/putrescine transport system substrate-binding protein [Dongia mobilis]|uniref:Putative spermidine/putrescine transport system substrate-binding protein n=1 Tax=Dongia mobilis TaxID=578943 RepID=A0A4R6WK03_9PROT|nr:ABC transporter substrate-binding protein [Dongia mobilis]TDQ78968.1 putative spermidine/putrescine transport system substrate-binding protein [Dongia mobilis]